MPSGHQLQLRLTVTFDTVSIANRIKRRRKNMHIFLQEMLRPAPRTSRSLRSTSLTEECRGGDAESGRGASRIKSKWLSSWQLSFLLRIGKLCPQIPTLVLALAEALMLSLLSLLSLSTRITRLVSWLWRHHVIPPALLSSSPPEGSLLILSLKLISCFLV